MASEGKPLLPLVKKCGACKETKDMSSFNKHSKRYDGRQSECRECHSKRNAANQAALTPRERKHYRIKSDYGIPIETYDQMIISQNGCCASCKHPFLRTPDIDHNHVSGKVRGLLCHNCNTALGMLQEDAAKCFSLAEYIRTHSESI